MSVTAQTAYAAAGDQLARRNAVVLSIAQALSGANAAVIFSTSGIVGATIAPDRGLATLPITFMVFGMWLGTLPVGYLAKSYGRRFALQCGTGFGILAGIFCCFGVLRGSFGLFLLGAFCGGLYAAAHQSYRFAATDTASDSFKPKAISWVLAGGIFAGFLGPQLVIFTKDLWQPYLFAASFVAQAAVAFLAGIVLHFLAIPRPAASEAKSRGRPLIEIVRMPRFIVAVVCGAGSYAMMNLIMTSAPLAMVDCGHSVTQATLGLQWHMLGMFAPSFFTGSLIVRFGVVPIILTGLATLAASAAVGIAGLTVAHFWVALILLGVGWNFAFIGATTLVTECHAPAERNKVQAFNDFLIFGSMAIGSFSSGKILASMGWASVNAVLFPITAVAAVLLIWLSLRGQPKSA